MSKIKKLKVGEGLEFKCSPTTPLGKVISYLQRMPLNSSESARTTLVSRYLPFALNPSDSDYRAISLLCAIECESWARAIREYCGLPPASIYRSIPGVQSYPLVSPVPLVKEISSSIETNELPTIEPEEDESNKFKQELQEIVDRASGADEARKKLVQLRQKEEGDWTEEQWDLWDEYCDEQQNIVHRQRYGELSEQLRGGSKK